MITGLHGGNARINKESAPPLKKSAGLALRGHRSKLFLVLWGFCEVYTAASCSPWGHRAMMILTTAERQAIWDTVGETATKGRGLLQSSRMSLHSSLHLWGWRLVGWRIQVFCWLRTWCHPELKAVILPLFLAKFRPAARYVLLSVIKSFSPRRASCWRCWQAASLVCWAFPATQDCVTTLQGKRLLFLPEKLRLTNTYSECAE